MASIHHDIFIAAAPEAIWRAARAVDRLHDLLVPGFVTATEMLEGEGAPVRRVTFANGHVVDEAIVSVDDDRRRLVWTVMDVSLFVDYQYSRGDMPESRNQSRRHR